MSPFPPRAPLPDSALPSCPVHVLIRDYPETHAVLVRHGVDVPANGARTVAELEIARRQLLLEELGRAMAWRSGP